MSAENKFERTVFGAEAPAPHVVLITPSDSVDVLVALRGIAFGTVGALKVTTLGGETVTIPSGVLAAGIIHPIMITRVWSTGTTAGNIVGVY